MKKDYFINIIITFLSIFQILQAQPKKAMIIANYKYDVKKYGWPAINSMNDIKMMKDFFTQQKFDTIIIRENLTKNEMVKAFSTFRQTLSAGDIAQIHISSHGQQVFDTDGDELDGYDEALVPVDCPATPKYLNSTEKHFTDDELYVSINSMRQVLGTKGTLILTVDACHSGSISRGQGSYRGGQAPFVPEGKVITKNTNSNLSESGFLTPEKKSTEKLGSFILITAAQPNQLAFEHEEQNIYYGSLSFAMAKTSSSITSRQSYRSWFSQIMNSMVKLHDVSNRPQIEGDIDQEMYGGKSIPQVPYFVITGTDKLPAAKLILNGGSLNGLAENSLIWILPAGVNSPSEEKIKAKGRIEKANLYSSWVTLNQPLPDISLKEIQSGYWAFRMEQSVPVRKTSVYTLKKSMISAINSNILEWSPEPVADYRIETNSKKSNSLQILNNQTGEKIIDDITENELGDNLNRIARADFLKGLSVEDPDAILKIRLLPVRTNSDNILDTLPHSFSLDGIPVFTTNDTAFLEIQNPTKNKLYFNIIDIQPDGLINTFFPRENYLPENCFIDAGRTILLKDLIRFNPPFGEEHFKVFVSKTPIDLSNLVNTRGASNGVMQALETVFAGSFKMETRGPVVEQVPSGSGSVSDYIFRIAR